MTLAHIGHSHPGKVLELLNHGGGDSDALDHGVGLEHGHLHIGTEQVLLEDQLVLGSDQHELLLLQNF